MVTQHGNLSPCPDCPLSLFSKASLPSLESVTLCVLITTPLDHDWNFPFGLSTLPDLVPSPHLHSAPSQRPAHCSLGSFPTILLHRNHQATNTSLLLPWLPLLSFLLGHLLMYTLVLLGTTPHCLLHLANLQEVARASTLSGSDMGGSWVPQAPTQHTALCPQSSNHPE